MISILILVGVILSGCVGNEKSDWETNPPFTYNNLNLYGVQDKFGMIKVNGESDEPEFPVNEGRQYQIYFIEKNFHGGSFAMTAKHESEGGSVKLYEAEIDDKQSGAKLTFDKKGL